MQKLKPPVYRQVIEAYYWHGKSYDDIAREFELPSTPCAPTCAEQNCN
ncbi:sigma-70 region 4 domain-containing protein [Candidatus Saccharibacteria bacterium]|nr:MAG: sigma-70 region 4 domain-containing protein [Candidatus Saccharibacteria bacterium]